MKIQKINIDLKFIIDQTISIYAAVLFINHAGQLWFLVGIFCFFFCLRFKFEIFNHERSERLKISNLNLKQTKKLKSQQQTY